MIDITTQIRKFAAGKAAWSTERGLLIARQIAQLVGAGIDWDMQSGENWIRVIVNDRVVALVSVVGPFAFLGVEVAEFCTAELSSVVIPDVEDAILTAERDALIYAFGVGVVSSSAFDPDCFSAEELWFVSV